MSPTSTLFMRGDAEGDSLASDLLYLATHEKLVTMDITPENDVALITIRVVDASGGESSAHGPLEAIVPAYASAMRQGGPFA